MFGRKSAEQNHKQQMVTELGHSVGHLRRAAGHLAMGTAERLTPTYDRARHAADQGWSTTRETLTPIYQQVRQGAANARNMPEAMKPQAMKMKAMQMRASKMKGPKQKDGQKRSKWRGLSSLLVAGAAVGAASAAVARRRRAQQAEWEEYEPMTGYDESRYAESEYGHRSPGAKVASGAASMADSLSSRAGRIADSLHERSATMQEKSMQGESDSGAHAAPMPPRTMGPSGDFAAPPTTPPMPGPGMGPGTPPGPVATPGMSANRDRLGDPALDFPEDR